MFPHTRTHTQTHTHKCKHKRTYIRTCMKAHVFICLQKRDLKRERAMEIEMWKEDKQGKASDIGPTRMDLSRQGSDSELEKKKNTPLGRGRGEQVEGLFMNWIVKHHRYL